MLLEQTPEKQAEYQRVNAMVHLLWGANNNASIDTFAAQRVLEYVDANIMTEEDERAFMEEFHDMVRGTRPKVDPNSRKARREADRATENAYIWIAEIALRRDLDADPSFSGRNSLQTS